MILTDIFLKKICLFFCGGVLYCSLMVFKTTCLGHFLVTVEYNRKRQDEGRNRMIDICQLRSIKNLFQSGLFGGFDDGGEPYILIDNIIEAVNKTEVFVVMTIVLEWEGFDFFF